MAGPMRVLVTEPLSERGLELLRQDFEVDVRTELAADGLAEAIGRLRRADRPIADPGHAASHRGGRELKVVARAGIGLDNVDVEAATAGASWSSTRRSPTSSPRQSTPWPC